MNLLSGRRLVIAYNAHSSRSRQVKINVFDKLDADGIKYDLLEVIQASLDENVERLKPLIRPHDLVLSAAGDGSAHAVVNAVIAAGQSDVLLGFLAYGNFNDLPHEFNGRSSTGDPVEFLSNAEVKDIFPLEIHADGQLKRYGLMYTTAGWTASAADWFNDESVRQNLVSGRTKTLRALFDLWWRYYLPSRKHSFLPNLSLNGKNYPKITDIICLNGRTLARLFRTSSSLYSRPVFFERTMDVSSVTKNIPFFVRGLSGHLDGKKSASTIVRFSEPSSIKVQCDGEVFDLTGISELVVKKSSQKLQILTTKI